MAAVAAAAAGAHVRHAEAVGGRRSGAEVVIESFRRLLHLHTQRPESQNSGILVVVLKNHFLSKSNFGAGSRHTHF